MTFRLPLLLYVMAVLAACLATFGPGGILCFAAWAFLALALVHIGSPENRASHASHALIMLLVLGVLIGFLIPAVQRAREASLRHACSYNLKLIGIALHAYSDDHGSFPPAYVADESGAPLHSWRVLILPYLNHQGLYDQYDFDEPWNGPNNRTLASQMPDIFACPKPSAVDAPETSYVAVVGPNTMFPGSNGRAFREVIDGTANTIAVVETADSYHWMEPRDMAFSEATDTTQRPFLSSTHCVPADTFFVIYEGGDCCEANVAYADAHVEQFSRPLDTDYLAARLTVAGQETLSQTATVEYERKYIGSENAPLRYRLHWRNIASLSMLVLLILLPAFWRPWTTKPAPSANTDEASEANEDDSPEDQ